MKSIAVEELQQLANTITHDQNELAYFDFHKKRYSLLLNKILELHRTKSLTKVLDIGNSFQTRFIDTYLQSVTIDTLGYTIKKFKPVRNHSHDIHFDLKNSDPSHPKIVPYHNSYDLVILAEVLEHLYIKPERLLTMIHSMLQQDGILIIQTPNAAFLSNRLKLLVGINPNMWIRDTLTNPGHFREYTKKELIHLATRTGYKIISVEGKNYFKSTGIAGRLAHIASSILPATFKNGFTIIHQKTT